MFHSCPERLIDSFRVVVGFQRDMETIWMSKEAQEEMEANLRLISRKTAKANFLLRNMRARWDLFREKHRDLAPLVNDRYTTTTIIIIACTAQWLYFTIILK